MPEIKLSCDEDRLRDIKSKIYEICKSYDFDYNDDPCLTNYFDVIKEALIFANMFNPQTDELCISHKPKTPNIIDVSVKRPVFKFDITLDAPKE